MTDQYAGKDPPQSVKLPHQLEIADTPWKRAVGLMFRQKAFPLLIEFNFQARHAIWMLFMRVPIDLVFLDARMTVVTIFENIPPLTLNPRTWRIYRPDRPAKYALEMPAGWVKNSALSPGTHLL